MRITVSPVSLPRFTRLHLPINPYIFTHRYTHTHTHTQTHTHTHTHTTTPTPHKHNNTPAPTHTHTCTHTHTHTHTHTPCNYYIGLWFPGSRSAPRPQTTRSSS